METRKILTLQAAPWCEDAARLLEGTLRGVPCFTVEDYRLELERNPDCKLFRVADDAGELVGFVVLRVERYEGGSEGVLLAAAGKLAGAQLYPQVLPILERMFSGVTTYRVDPCRRGAIAELLKAGYLPTHMTMRKAASLPARSQQELLEELALLDDTGGPDLRATPQLLHKGGSSSSAAQSTTNTDRRLVVDNGSVGFSSDGGTYTVNVTDRGAVAAAIALAGDSNKETLGFTRDIFAAGLTVLDKAGRQVEAQTALVAKAYDAAQGEGTQKNLIAAAALATVAIVAVKVWGK